MDNTGARLAAPMPANISRELLPTGLRFSYRWFGWWALFLAFFCVFWDGFLISWYSHFDFSSKADRDIDWTMVLFPLGHVAVGVGLTYFTLCVFVNRTIVNVSPQELRVSHGPLPWPGNRTVPSMQIAQVYREAIVQQTRKGTRTSYQLSAVTKDNRKIKLLSSVPEADLALYLEQEIEKHLGIRDQPVAGEMRK